MRQREKCHQRTSRVAVRKTRSTGCVLARILALAAILLNLDGGRIFALNPGTLISQYGHTVWRIQDGALAASPTSFAQTPDGYIWVGTEGGLFRFDGVTFAPWNPPPGQNYAGGSAAIRSLFAAKDGSLWIGATGLSHLEGGTFTRISAPLAVVTAIAEDRDGAIWIAREHQSEFTGPLCKVSAGNEHCYGVSDGLRTFVGASMALDAQGQFWVGGEESAFEWNGKLIREIPLPGRKSNNFRVLDGIAVDANGTVWAGSDQSGLHQGLLQLINGTWHVYAAPGFDPNLSVRSILLDRENRLWIGTGEHGLYRIRGNSVEHFGREDGLSGNSVKAIFQDREGGIWVATDEGIDYFHDLTILKYSTAEGLGYEVTSVLARRDGSIAVGSESYTLASIRGSRVISEKSRIPGGVGARIEDHSGNLWGCSSGGELYAERNGRFQQVVEHVANSTCAGITEDTDHGIWAWYYGPHSRLVHIQSFRVQEEFTPPQAPPVFSVIADPDGGIWLSPFDESLMHYRNGKWQTLSLAPLTQKYGTKIANVFNMWIDSSGALWGATAGGIIGYKYGNLRLLGARNGLPCTRSYSMITDLSGDLWIQAQCGLVRVDHSELERWWANPESKLNVSTYTAVDGFRSGIPYSRTAITRGLDGKIWFHNQSVVMMVDPSKLVGNTVVPPVHVEQVIADRKAYSVGGDLRLPARTRELELDYTGLSFAVPSRVLFRYILEGYDTQWQEPGTRRAAFYNDLGPGNYTFRVMACNDSGLWNSVGTSLQFTILPAYYQTYWFRTMCGIAFLALLWLIYQLRLRRLQQEFAIGLEARVNERTRIARELHDTLLQSFNALLLRLQTVSNVLPVQPDEAKIRVDRAIEQASNAVTEGRDKVHELRSGGSGTAELERSLSDFAGEVLSGSTSEPLPTVHVRVEGTPRPLNPVVRDEAYRIAAEGMRNAIRHAKARRIEVEIRYDERQLRLRIRDDGAGIDPAILESEHKAGHWGLRGMRERAKLVGGTLELWSQVGTGTEVELNIPAESAYASSPARTWAAFFRVRRV